MNIIHKVPFLLTFVKNAKNVFNTDFVIHNKNFHNINTIQMLNIKLHKENTFEIQWYVSIQIT